MKDEFRRRADEAADANAAIEVAAKEYNVPDPRRLIAVARR
ncbi:MAG TPA: hypothetical protein VKP67_27790 [Xanthobacteraceae bacterium]|nr:hypothetical protein [Xanthobacteraceae bacterium]